MRIVIDTSSVRLSPAEKLTLQNITNRQPKPPPLPVGVQESIDNAFGEPDRRALKW